MLLSAAERWRIDFQMPDLPFQMGVINEEYEQADRFVPTRNGWYGCVFLGAMVPQIGIDKVTSAIICGYLCYLCAFFLTDYTA